MKNGTIVHALYFQTMAGWQLEVFKMVMYVSFPVAMFHYFNQPGYFEKWVTETKRQVYPHENDSHREEIEKCIRQIRNDRDKEMLSTMASRGK